MYGVGDDGEAVGVESADQFEYCESGVEEKGQQSLANRGNRRDDRGRLADGRAFEGFAA